MTNPIIRAGEGSVHNVLGMTHINKVLPGAGPGLIMDVTAPPGHGTPHHIHDEDEEAFYILEGELTVETLGQVATIGPGDMCSLPAGIEHAFRNEGAVPVRFLAVVTPGIDALAFFTEVDRAGARGAVTPDTVAQIAGAHGLAVLPAA